MNEHSEAKHKLVSIIIPTYNAGKYIEQAVKCVIEQNYQNWEMIIVDDGSTDNTSSVVFPFLNDKRITYVKKENGGVSNARNYGANLAKGEYLCFLDADDFFHPDNISEKMNILNSDASIGLVHADVRMTDEQGKPSGSFNTGLSGSNLYLNLLAWNECVIPAPSSIMIRRDVFYSIGMWDPAFSTAADQDFFIRVTHNYKIHRIHKALTSYRVVNASMSKNVPLFEKDHMGVYAKAKQNGMFPDKVFERTCFANLHLIIAGNWWRHNRHIAKTVEHLLIAFSFSPRIVFKRLKIKLFQPPATHKLILQKKWSQ